MFFDMRQYIAAGGLVLTLVWYAVSRARSRCAGDAPLFSSMAHHADYTDRYCAPLASSTDIESVAAGALQRGRELARSKTEVVYEDRAPGLRFVVGYELIDTHAALGFSTAVFYQNPLGIRYFRAVRPFHRLLAPAVPVITARRALASSR